MTYPTNINEIAAELRAPFETKELGVRIGNKSKAGDKATVIVYTDAQVIEERLDRLVGVGGWEVHFSAIGTGGIEATLSILGVMKAATADVGSKGEGRGEPIGVMSAEARAFKRAASRFGIARYLWSDSKQVWAELDSTGYKFADSDEVLIGRVLGAKSEPRSNEPRPQADRPARPAPAREAYTPKTTLSEGQVKMLNGLKVPQELIDQITPTNAKGKTYKGDGWLDSLKELQADLGKKYGPADAIDFLVGQGLKYSATATAKAPASVNDIEDYDDYEDEV